MRIIAEDTFVTALFFDESKASNDALTELENIDDEADIFEIRFVRIQDDKLAEDFSLEAIPSLVYFRDGIPIVYQVMQYIQYTVENYWPELASCCTEYIKRTLVSRISVHVRLI